MHFIQTSLLMLPLTHSTHNTLVSTCVKAQLKQLTQAKVIAQAKWGFSKNQREHQQLWGRLFLAITWVLDMPRLGQMLRQATYHESQKPCFEGFLEILITLDLHIFSQVYKKLCEKIAKPTYKNKNLPINFWKPTYSLCQPTY